MASKKIPVKCQWQGGTEVHFIAPDDEHALGRHTIIHVSDDSTFEPGKEYEITISEKKAAAGDAAVASSKPSDVK